METCESQKRFQSNEFHQGAGGKEFVLLSNTPNRQIVITQFFQGVPSALPKIKTLYLLILNKLIKTKKVVSEDRKMCTSRMMARMSAVFSVTVCANVKIRNVFECPHDVVMTTALFWIRRW